MGCRLLRVMKEGGAMTGKWVWLLIGAVVVMVVVGCGGGGSSSSQDFIVGTWDAYALSDSFSGDKVAIEEAGISYRLVVSANGTWVDYGSAPGVPPYSGSGTWFRQGDDYIIYEPGLDDVMLYREGSELYQVEWIDGFGLVWVWYHRA